MKVIAATFLEGTRERIYFDELDEGRLTELSGRTSGVEDLEFPARKGRAAPEDAHAGGGRVLVMLSHRSVGVDEEEKAAPVEEIKEEVEEEMADEVTTSNQRETT